MRAYKLSQLSDAALLRGLATLVARNCTATAALLAHIAEVDARQLYARAGHASMHAYCVDALHLSEDAAYKRIQAARAARRHPVLFAAVADGRVHLSAVCMLAPHLTARNVRALVAAVSHRRKPEIERFLAERFGGAEQLAIAPVAPDPSPAAGGELAPGQVVAGDRELAPGQVEPAPPPIAPAGKVKLHCELSPITRDKLRYAQALLSHAVPSGDTAEIIDRALDVLIAHLEQRKFAAARRPGEKVAGKTAPRTVPAHVKRAVWQRDAGRCAFVSDDGHRCGARTRLELDHVTPVARGGTASADGMRLLCRTHNQFEAERVLGRDFMRRKREAARNRAANRPGAVPVPKPNDRAKDVQAALRSLGVGAREAQRVAALAPGQVSLEDSVRVALRALGRRPVMHVGRSTA